MPHTEKQLLEEALGLPLTEATFDWSAFKAEYHIAHDTPEHDAADRAFFTWQHFRGAHTAQSCLLDDEGRVRGLIVKGTDLVALRIPALPALEYLCVCDNERLTTLTLTAADYPLLQYIDWSNNQLDQVELRAGLPLLRYLNVSRNKVKTMHLPDALPALEELNASKNEIKNCTLPDTLDALCYLFLNENEMTTLQTGAALQELRSLHLKGNQLTQLPEAEYTHLETLYVKGNPLAGFGESLLEGDGSGNAVEIIAALRSFAQTGSQPNYRAKLIIVGNGRIGKTCLIKRLKGQDCTAKEKYTHGIAISQMEKQDLPNVHTDELYLNVWDFGGQEVFYATHQFFLSEDAAYIYAWTDKAIADANWENDDDADKSPVSDKWREHDYWLDNIRMHGKDSPVLVVKTHCLDTTSDFPAERLMETYNMDWRPVDFDAFSPEIRYLDNLRTAVTGILNNLKLLGDPMPKGFYNLVRHIAELREAGEKELPRAAFDASLETFSIPAKDADAALSYLRKTGEVIYFPDSPRLRNKVFTDPGVLTERIYKLIENNDELTRNEGSFAAADARQKLEADWEDLLELLIAFQLVYRKTTQGQITYIAPQYLPPLPTKGNARTLFAGHEQGKPLRFTLFYPRFMPENVMVNVLSAYGPYAMDAAYKDAIFFCKQGHEDGCVIRADEAKRIIYVHSAPTPAGNALAREVFLLFVELSKKAELHIAASGEKWVLAKALESAMDNPEVSQLPTTNNNTVEWVKMSDFAFLQVEKGQFREEKSPTPEPPTPTPTDNDMTERIRQLVAKNKVPEALAELAKIKPNEVIGLQQQFAQLKSDERLGVKTSGEIDTKRNKIVAAILAYATDIDTTPEPTSGDSGGTSAKRILFTAASPMNEARLQLDLEYNKIQKELKLGRHYHLFEFLPPVFAATVQDLLRAMNDQPEIVHFSGHGQQEGILVASDDNQARLLPTPALVRLFKPVKNTTKCVLLNSCYSEEQAKVISELGILVIGYNAPVGDTSAIEFVRGFYTGLGEGKDFESSFNDAMIAWSTNATGDVSAAAWLNGELLNW